MIQFGLIEILTLSLLSWGTMSIAFNESILQIRHTNNVKGI